MKEKLEKIHDIFSKNVSAYYYVLFTIFICGFIFFINSNSLFNKEMASTSTELNTKLSMDSIDLVIKDRQYNPNNGLFQITFKVSDNSILKDINLDFEIRERNKPTLVLDSKVNKISDSDYIITSYINYAWETVSTTIINSNVDRNNIIKVYSDMKDTTINNNLKEKDLKEYTLEIIENDIAEVEKNIQLLEQSTIEKQEEIQKINDNINKLEEDKKYQTDSEIEATNNKISDYKNKISSLEINIKSNNITKEEAQEKIKKLEEKKSNFK
ncbi:hypothetical protein H9660_14165 [Clostridium sp. Sa3CUN1]|uniref:Chromosome segregation protein SMC n=1 Tax=Clostridium gallinarum TaxID=2762246 RepID=A0ABR8Q791_9CLOT|nr:hypothetical protein [Clostridium gallinarum]MBD7916288.1 hypothetical protein [Clostridium gallinarum]